MNEWIQNLKLKPQIQIVVALIQLISVIATFITYQEAGLTVLFGILAGITIIIFLVIISLPELQKRVVVWVLQYKIKNNVEARMQFEYLQRIRVVDQLWADFTRHEKAFNLTESLQGRRIKVVAIRTVKFQLGVILNIGKSYSLQPGTRFLVLRVEHDPSASIKIEIPLCIVEVTHVQEQGNLSHAIIIEQFDQKYWKRIIKQLKENKEVPVPQNIARPFIPDYLPRIKISQVSEIRAQLEEIRGILFSPSQISKMEEEL